MQVLAYLLALAGVCPFVGSLSDLIGRRWVAILGASLVCLGMIVCSTANTMNILIGTLRGLRLYFGPFSFFLEQLGWPLLAPVRE